MKASHAAFPRDAMLPDHLAATASTTKACAAAHSAPLPPDPGDKTPNSCDANGGSTGTHLQ